MIEKINLSPMEVDRGFSFAYIAEGAWEDYTSNVDPVDFIKNYENLLLKHGEQSKIV